MRRRTWRCVSWLAALSVVAGCARPAGGDTTIPSITTVPSTSAVADATTTSARERPSTTTTTATTAPPADFPPLLAAGTTGITMISASGTATVWGGADVAVVLPDGGGGIVFQRFGEQPQPIEWLPGGMPSPVVLAPATGARMLAADQTFDLDGRPQLLYRRSVRLPSDCTAGDEECHWAYDRTYLVLRDLETGIDRILGAIGSFESSGVRYQVGDPWTALAIDGYGDLPACVGLAATADLLGPAAGVDRWIGEGGPLAADCALGPAAPCGDEPACDGIAFAVPSPDGAVLTSVSGYWVGEERPRLVLLDIAGNREIASMEIGRPGTIPAWIDFDGRIAVVGLRDPTQEWSASGDAVAVLADGSVLPLGTYRHGAFWRARVGAGLDRPRIVLGSHGLGETPFGTPVDETLTVLTEVLGLASSDSVVTAGSDAVPCGANGYGCLDYLRLVGWEADGLWAVFLNTTDDPAPHLAGWSSSGTRIATPEGFVPGATVAVLTATFGESLTFGAEDPCAGGWSFHVSLPEERYRYYGFLSGDPADPSTVVTTLLAGAQSSC